MITELGQIQANDEGRLLLAAISILMKGAPAKTPDQIVESLNIVAKGMFDKMGDYNPVPISISIITRAIKMDPSYREGWKANIAMAFQDEFTRQLEATPIIGVDTIHTISNAAADNFLNSLCR